MDVTDILNFETPASQIIGVGAAAVGSAIAAAAPSVLLTLGEASPLAIPLAIGYAYYLNTTPEGRAAKAASMARPAVSAQDQALINTFGFQNFGSNLASAQTIQDVYQGYSNPLAGLPVTPTEAEIGQTEVSQLADLRNLTGGGGGGQLPDEDKNPKNTDPSKLPNVLRAGAVAAGAGGLGYGIYRAIDTNQEISDFQAQQTAAGVQTTQQPQTQANRVTGVADITPTQNTIPTNTTQPTSSSGILGGTSVTTENPSGTLQSPLGALGGSQTGAQQGQQVGNKNVNIVHVHIKSHNRRGLFV